MKWLALALLALAACRTTQGAGLTPREQAHVLVERGRWAEALPVLESLHQASPDDLDLARQLAEAHVRGGSASTLLSRLEGRRDAIACYQRGLVRFSIARQAAEPAIAELRCAVEARPDAGELHYRLGLALLESERDAEAKAELEQALALNPTKSAWALPVAKARLRLGDIEGGVAALRQVIAGSPSAAEIATARALMETALAPRMPETARPRFEQGLQWLQVADVPQRAIVAFEELLQDFPDLSEVHALLGLAYLRLDDGGRAVDELQRAIELAPKDGRPYLYLGQLYLARQRSAQAKELLEKAVAKNPLLDDAWLALGDLALDRNDHLEARRCFQTLASLQPQAFAPRGKLALVLQREGDWPAAERELETARSHEPENPEIWLRLGLLHLERSQRAPKLSERDDGRIKARPWLEKVLERQPDNAIASQALEVLNRATATAPR